VGSVTINFSRKLGIWLLGVLLILWGLTFFGFGFQGLHYVMGILAIVSGVCIVLDQ
jgi:hypothetical protein